MTRPATTTHAGSLHPARDYSPEPVALDWAFTVQEINHEPASTADPSLSRELIHRLRRPTLLWPRPGGGGGGGEALFGTSWEHVPMF